MSKVRCEVNPGPTWAKQAEARDDTPAIIRCRFHCDGLVEVWAGLVYGSAHYAQVEN